MRREVLIASLVASGGGRLDLEEEGDLRCFGYCM